ncbi:MAG TPA: sigma-70 family RNA polymerase sigma factor [Pyrinomonadaceae bacterium]|nr:sigma-70 family RNA polymerase sigma factor [Pyrinomonadaceae bacterium]
MRPEPAQDNDVELLKAVAARNEAALGQIYDRYRVILFGVLLRILNDRAEAEDVLQETFLQVWRRAADFDEKRGRPFTWLVTLARSRGIDRLRTLASRERVAQACAKENPEEEYSDAATDVVKSEQRGVVNKALDQLPEEQKRPLMLAYFDGLTQSEIAAHLGAPLGTVKTRMRAGMMKLRELLSGREEYFGY